jgi:hypothetical protein
VSASDQVYPFSTQDGKAIPLDIINPAGVIYQVFTNTASSLITIPGNYTVGTFKADADSIISFGADLGALVANTLHANTIFLPANVIVTSVIVPGSAYVRGLTASGTVYLQLIQKWAGLSLTTQLVRK